MGCRLPRIGPSDKVRFDAAYQDQFVTGLGAGDRPRPPRRRSAAPSDRERRSAGASARARCRPGSRSRRPARWPPSSGVARGVVVEAYAQLVAEGYLTSRAAATPGRAGGDRGDQRRGRLASARCRAEAAVPPSTSATAARTSRPFPRRLAALRPAGPRRDPDERLGYLDGRGAIELRSALAAYLNRVRGTNADPGDDRHHQRLRPGDLAAARRARRPRRTDASRSRTRRPPTTPARSPPRSA